MWRVAGSETETNGCTAPRAEIMPSQGSTLGSTIWPYNKSKGARFHCFPTFRTLPMSSSPEQTPLLNGTSQHPRSPSFYYPKMVAFLKAEGEPSWLASFQWFIFGSWLNLLLLLVPIAAAAHYLDWDAPLRFGFSFVAIIPLAKVRNFQSGFRTSAGFCC